MPLIQRKRLHAAFFIFPEYADTVPTLSVVSTLVRRGYRVSYFTTDRFAGNVAKLGAEFVRCPARSDYPSNTHNLHSLVADTLAGVASFYERNRPDVIILDTVCLVGRILANRLHIPTIQVSPDFMMDKRTPSRLAPEFFKAALDGSSILEDVLARYGIATDTFLFSRAKLNIYFYSKLFQLDDGCHEERCFYAGRCAPERPYSRKWMPKWSHNRPVALISTSTLFVQGEDYFRMCIDALGNLDWHVILQLGESHDPAGLAPLPDHCEMVKGEPQIAVLPYVDLLICAGGMMTTMEAMYCGVPLLMMTHANSELEAYAENSVRLGLGRHLRKATASPDTIRSCVLQMSEDVALHNRVRQMQQVIRAEPGAEDVANRISEYVESSR